MTSNGKDKRLHDEMVNFKCSLYFKIIKYYLPRIYKRLSLIEGVNMQEIKDGKLEKKILGKYYNKK